MVDSEWWESLNLTISVSARKCVRHIRARKARNLVGNKHDECACNGSGAERRRAARNGHQFNWTRVCSLAR